MSRYIKFGNRQETYRKIIQAGCQPYWNLNYYDVTGNTGKDGLALFFFFK